MPLKKETIMLAQLKLLVGAWFLNWSLTLVGDKLSGESLLAYQVIALDLASVE